MPMLVASDEAHIINTSSVNGFWATVGPMTPHSAYSAAKFAVKGFTEALIVDLRMNAPHVRCSVVMPGHIGTSIALNTSAVLGKHSAMELDDQEVSDIRERYLAFGLPVDNVPDDHIRQMVRQQQEDFEKSVRLRRDRKVPKGRRGKALRRKYEQLSEESQQQLTGVHPPCPVCR